MKIKTKVTSEKELVVALPFFRKKLKFKGRVVQYIAVLPDETCICLTVIEEQTTTFHGKAQDRAEAIKEAFLKWETIEEEEFLTAHKNLLKSLSLEPVVVPDPNDIANVNI